MTSSAILTHLLGNLVLLLHALISFEYINLMHKYHYMSLNS